MHTADHNRRQAFTLLELLLVLVLAAAVAGMTVAVMKGRILQTRLNESVSNVRTAWSEARSEAITRGDRLVFTCQIDGKQFRLSSCNDLCLEGESTEAFASEGTLSDGIIFRALQAAPRDTASDQLAEGGGNGEWSSPVVFDPDGTSYDAVVVLESERGRQIEVTLRGLTCTTTVRDVPANERVK